MKQGDTPLFSRCFNAIFPDTLNGFVQKSMHLIYNFSFLLCVHVWMRANTALAHTEVGG